MAELRENDRSIAELARLAYDEMHRLAESYLQRERAHHTLRPTELVHEAFVKLAEMEGADRWRSRTHFQAVSASAMRQILVDHARRRASQKHGGPLLRITLTPQVAIQEAPDVDLIALDEAMNALAQYDARKCRVVELRFFGGLTCEEVASTLGIAPKTAEADWYFARAWLRKKLREPA